MKDEQIKQYLKKIESGIDLNLDERRSSDFGEI